MRIRLGRYILRTPPVIRWLFVGGGFFVLAMFLSFFLVSSFVDFGSDKQNNVVPAQRFAEKQDGLSSGTGGEEFDYLIPKEKSVQKLEDVENLPSLMLIPERQEAPLKPVAVPGPEKAKMQETVGAFLPIWETFEPGMDMSSWEVQLRKFVAEQAIDDVISRDDSHQPADIGHCSKCTTGSRFDEYLLPAVDLMVVRDYDDDRAYVTTQGVVSYTNAGGSQGAWRRSYAFLLEKDDATGRWMVVRAAAETLEEAI